MNWVISVFEDVAVVLLEPRLVPAAFADLHDVFVFGERADLGPVSQHGLASPAREREVHACRGSQCLRRGVAFLLREVAVPVDVHQPSPAGESEAIQRTEQDTAIAADDDRESPGGELVSDLAGERKRERADAMTVAESRARFCVEVIRGPLELNDFRRAERLLEPRLHQDLRRLPGAGLAAVFWAKAKVTWRKDQ